MLGRFINALLYCIVLYFTGLQSLEHLDLSRNKLVDLPKGIFADLFNLFYLDLNFNYFTSVPCHTLASLCSLMFLMFINHGDISQIDFDGLQNLKNLTVLHLALSIDLIDTDIGSDIIQPLDELPLTTFIFVLDPNPGISTDIFSPVKKITVLTIAFEMLPALTSLSSPLQDLALTYSSSNPDFVDMTSLQVLQK